MKTVKSLLLGSAAGLVAVAGAQAADLPLKAKPVEYVKVCSLYGEGFYYMPGTDTCIKIGGYLRADYNYGANPTFSPGIATYNSSTAHVANQGQPGSGALPLNNRESSQYTTRARILWTFDVRSQTEYGTLRAYSRTGIQWSTGDSTNAGSGATAYIDRAFIQFAGFTFGRAVSFFDNYVLSMHSFQTNFAGSDTGGTGINIAGYTFQLGNGFSASFSAEEKFQRIASETVNTSVANFLGVGTQVTNNSEGQQYPDFVASLRVDQAWGTAQINGAIHDASASYYGTTVGGLVANGHPGNELGYAAGGGLILNLPWQQGDTFGVSFVYSVGALGYVGNQNNYTYYQGGNVALGFIANGVYTGTTAATGTNIELTTGWSVTAGIEHYWTPALRTSLYGAYQKYDYNDVATARICAGNGTATLNITVAAANCNPDFAVWQIGSRTVWNPVKNLDVGVEVMYSKIQTAFGGNGALLPAVASQGAGTYNIQDLGQVSGMMRVQRNFNP